MERKAPPGQAGTIAFLLATAGAVATAALHDPIPQPPEYHRFADDRTLLGIPNALDVLSSLGFAIVGAWGLVALRRSATFLDRRERYPWLALFAGVALASAGSAWYHLRPDDSRLVWDRLPVTLGFMGLFAALIGERASVRWGARLLAPLVLLGAASVGYWAWRDDLVPYLVVQFYPLLAIPLLLALFPARYTRGADLLVALAWYLLAKGAEIHDAEVFQGLGFVSGHTLKHLLAAAGAGWLVAMLVQRRPAPPVAPGAASARAAG